MQRFPTLVYCAAFTDRRRIAGLLLMVLAFATSVASAQSFSGGAPTIQAAWSELKKVHAEYRTSGGMTPTLRNKAIHFFDNVFSALSRVEQGYFTYDIAGHTIGHAGKSSIGNMFYQVGKYIPGMPSSPFRGGLQPTEFFGELAFAEEFDTDLASRIETDLRANRRIVQLSLAKTSPVSFAITYGDGSVWLQNPPAGLQDAVNNLALNNNVEPIRGVFLKPGGDGWLVLAGRNTFTHSGLPPQMASDLNALKTRSVTWLNGPLILPPPSSVQNDAEGDLLESPEEPPSVYGTSSNSAAFRSVDPGEEINDIVFRSSESNGDSWLIRYRDNLFKQHGMPPSLVTALENHRTQSTQIGAIYVNNDDSWMFLGGNQSAFTLTESSTQFQGSLHILARQLAHLTADQKQRAILVRDGNAGFCVLIKSTKANLPRRDINRDGRQDFIFQNRAGQIYTWFLNEYATKAEGAWLSTIPLEDWRLAGVADVNGDQLSDLIFQNNKGQIYTWRMLGDSPIRNGWLSDVELGDWKIVCTTDLNQDGFADLLFQNNAGQIYAWYLNKTGGRLGSGWVSTANLDDWRIVSAADLNRDEIPDLLFQNSRGLIAVWYMTATGEASESNLISWNDLGDWRVTGTADINCDGFSDLIFQNTAGQIYAWYSDGWSGVADTAWISKSHLEDWRLR